MGSLWFTCATAGDGNFSAQYGLNSSQATDVRNITVQCTVLPAAEGTQQQTAVLADTDDMGGFIKNDTEEKPCVPEWECSTSPCDENGESAETCTDVFGCRFSTTTRKKCSIDDSERVLWDHANNSALQTGEEREVTALPPDEHGLIDVFTKGRAILEKPLAIYRLISLFPENTRILTYIVMALAMVVITAGLVFFNYRRSLVSEQAFLSGISWAQGYLDRGASIAQIRRALRNNTWGLVATNLLLRRLKKMPKPPAKPI